MFDVCDVCVVDRITDLFTHNEADDIKDRKDKFKRWGLTLFGCFLLVLGFGWLFYCCRCFLTCFTLCSVICDLYVI